MQIVILSVALFLAQVLVSEGRLAGECAAMCNDLRFEVLTLEMCRDAKRTLPRPKVGDFCSTAMEQGFSDACVGLCMDQKPVARVAQTCRAAAIEMPRPTVRRWCEHGYTVAYEKAMKDLGSHFTPDTDFDAAANVVAEPAFTAEEEAENAALIAAQKRAEEQAVRVAEHEARLKAMEDAESEQKAAAAADTSTAGLRGGGVASEGAEVAEEDTRPVVATIPITIEDETKDLIVHEGQNAEEAVVVFCRVNVPTDVTACIRQLLPTVIEKIDEITEGA